MRDLSDDELVSLYKKSVNQAIIGELYERYVHLVLGVCIKYLKHREDARDASVEVFEILQAKLHTHEVVHFKSWLYSVSKNHCLMKLRKKSFQIELRDDLTDIVETGIEPHPDSVRDKEEQLIQLEQAMITLNEEQRQSINLFYLAGLSYQQIMDKTGFTFKEVKSFIQNGKRNLKLEMMNANERKTS